MVDKKEKKRNKAIYILVVIFIVLIFILLFSQKIPVVKDILPAELGIENIIKKKEVPKYQTIADGTYFDRLSKRATMEVNFEDSIYHFEINWSSSAKENTKWTFSGKFDKYNSLVHYTDSRCVTEIYEDDGTMSEAEVYTDGHGVMKYDNKVLYWVDENEDKNYDPNYNAIFEKPRETSVDGFTNTYNITNNNYYPQQPMYNYNPGYMVVPQQQMLNIFIARYDRNATRYNNGAPMVTRIPIIGSNNQYLADVANSLLPSAYKSIEDYVRTNVSFTKYQDYFLNYATIKSFTTNRIYMTVNCSLQKKGVLSEHLTFSLTLELDGNRYEWEKVSDSSSRRVY